MPNVTVTLEEAAMLRRLADEALQEAPLAPSFNPEDVRCFVYGACVRDQPTCGPGYRSAVAEMVVDHLDGHGIGNPSTFLQHLFRRAEAIFGQAQSQPAAQAFCPDRAT